MKTKLLLFILLSFASCKKEEAKAPVPVNDQPNLHSDVIRFTITGGSETYTASYAKFTSGTQVWHPFTGVHSGWFLDIPLQAWDCSSGPGICVDGYSFDVQSTITSTVPVTMHIIYHADTIFSYSDPVHPAKTGIMEVGVPFGRCY